MCNLNDSRTLPGSSSRERGRHEAGQSVIIVAMLALPILLAFLGLAIDVGYLRYMQRRMQSASDAAAMAGAAELSYGSATTAARTDASKNGFTNGTGGVSVTVNTPPVSGPNAGSIGYVEVIVAQTQPTYFMRAVGINSVMVRGRAVGYLGSGPNCMYSLSPNASGALKLSPSGGYAVQAQCGIVIDSTSCSALRTNGNSLTADSIGIVASPGCSGCADCGSNVTPPPQSNIVPVPDPLAYLATPTPSGTTYSNGTNPVVINNTSCTPASACTNLGPQQFALKSGIYPYGITIGVSSGTQPNVTLSGAYYITGGTLNILNGSTYNNNDDTVCNHHVNLHGSNVFIYLGPSAKVSMGGGNGKFVNSCGGLSATTTGTYAGILFFQDRSTANYTANVSSGQGEGFSGALYFPSVALRFNNSNPTSAQYMILVAQTLELYRDMTSLELFNYDTSGLPNGSPIKRAVLVE
jgi:hypothetical protein